LYTSPRARSIGQIAYEALRSARGGPVGSVIACFQNSFYIKTLNDQLIFVTNRLLKSPMTINLGSSTDFGHLKPLEGVFFEQPELRVGDLTIDLSGAPIQGDQFSITALRIGRLQEALYAAATILAIVDTRLSVLDNTWVSFGKIGQFARTGILSVRDSGGNENFRATAGEIIGLGGGFTPSGDDLLAGFLATYNSFATALGRNRIIIDFETIRQSTNWISAKILDYMQREVYDDQVSQLIRSVAMGNQDEFIMAIEALLPRGHTSGVDIAVGSILAGALLVDLSNNGHETEAVTNRLGLS